MNADDDPEARIRDLERPLSDFARAAELTVPSVGTEGQAPPPRGNGRGITVGISALAAVFAIAAAAAVFLIAGGPTSTTPGHPALPSGAAPEPSTAPVDTPEAPVSPSPAVPVPGSAVTITISGAGENKTLACAGRDVTVSGVSNTVVLTGECTGLTVSGIGNAITVDSTPTITASGFNNRVTYRFGDPQVSTSGLDNVVERG
ncbi:membrane protein [Mycolicibacter terrae]|uniref:Membrane protein n=1 Tax=Mycolicibacter terrae TaxID=1788 RepID=A0AAD1HYM5_9MYCO|nr:DUF3060 domain-containing protein [Mycolicibacter terrae]ORW96409.1 hypothetical protein AWC28_10465 [Mycolicibacter terrae]BBX23209.1 membrane protein [Mycolicibacter terrae]SNV66489.1 putative conserved membrane protein [Mycolicibacter terrae]